MGDKKGFLRLNEGIRGRADGFIPMNRSGNDEKSICDQVAKDD